MNMNEIIQQHYLKHRDKLVSRAKNVLGDWHYGEDCTQEAYENAIRYFHTFNGTNFDGWFFAIFLNMLRKYLRFIKSQGVSQEIKTADHPLFPTEIQDQYMGLIEEEILKSNKKDRVKEMLYLYFICGYRGKEMESLTGMSESSIHTQANRFKQNLMEKYDVFKKT
jgi:RNA polymerase sigma factor (sigma-70 family)